MGGNDVPGTFSAEENLKHFQAENSTHEAGAAGSLMAEFPKSADGFFLVQKLDSAVRILFLLLSLPSHPS